jgi:hypothetical protein
VVLNYVRVTTPVLCVYDRDAPQASVQSMQQQQHQGELVWDLVCGRWGSLTASKLGSSSNSALQLSNRTSTAAGLNATAAAAAADAVSNPIAAFNALPASAPRGLRVVGHWIQVSYAG